MELFVTYGSGLEPFVTNELRSKFGLDSRCNNFPGKIFFTIPEPGELGSNNNELIHRFVHELKTVERLFGILITRNVTADVSVKPSNLKLTDLYEMASESTFITLLKNW